MDADEASNPRPEHSVESAVVVEFLRRYAADRDAGDVRELPHYLARFPGFESMIEAEFARLTRADGPDDPAAAPVSVGDSRVSDPAELARAISADRYEVLQQIGRGGMGIVSRVRDRRLGRDLAMKVIADRSGSKPGTGSSSVHWRRFVDEAQITGQLAHPGIVPVHDLGIDANGRVFFTMALVRGEQFRTVIGRVHDPADRGWTTSRALQVVIRVCEAVAYAHANGVIHRDLKPTNVMVGAFGETYVLDWGLARVLAADRREPGGGSELVDGPSSRTLAGDVLGTPAYMSPEQARGEHDRVGPESDVYSVGAILYHLLTGSAPYATEASSHEIVQRVLAGPPPDVLASGRQIAPELAAICEKAMARDLDARYASVAELADDLRAFVDVRVVRAYETGAFAEARKWVRRNRALAATGFVAVLALVVGLVFSILQMRVADEQATRADAQAELAAEEAARADANFAVASDVVERMLTHVVGTGLADVPQLAEFRRDLLVEAVRYRRALDDGSPAASAELGRSLALIARVHDVLGELADAESAASEAIERLRRGLEGDPARVELAMSIVGAHSVLGNAALDRERFEDARARYDAGLEFAAEWSERTPHDVELLRARAKILNNRGNLEARVGEHAAALASRREAADLGVRVVEDEDARAGDRAFAGAALQNLASSLFQNGDLDAAESTLQRAFGLLETASPGDPAERSRRSALGAAFGMLAMVRAQTGRPTQAAAAFEAAAEQYAELAADFPSVADYRYELGRCLSNFGRLQFEAGDVDDAIATLTKSLAATDAAIEIVPDNLKYRRTRISMRKAMCSVLLSIGRVVAASESALCLGEDSPIDGALFLCVCIDRATEDRELEPAERGGFLGRCATTALRLLRDGLADEDDVEGSLMLLTKPELDVIRDREGFRELESTLRSRADGGR